MKPLFEQLGGKYHEADGYLIPDLKLLPEKEAKLGIWSRRHLQYLREHKRIRYVNLLTSGGLNQYLADVDRRAADFFFRLVKEYADRQGVTEQLKAENQLEWVRRMNHIRACVEEVIYKEIIYV